MASINESIKNLLTRESIYQAYLDVEVALAKAQAKQEIIPLWAATKIQEKGKLELLDIENVDAGLEKTGHPLVPLIWELDRVCGDDAGGYIHLSLIHI